MTDEIRPASGAMPLTRQEELAQLAKKSFDGGLSPEEVERVKALMAEEEAERSFEPPIERTESGLSQEEIEERLMSPGTGVGAYDAMLVHPEKPQLPPEEAIPALFEKMKPYRKFLLAILNACREEAETEAVDAAVEPEYEFCGCVYTPIALRKMLVEAGALEYIQPDLPEDEPAEEAPADETGETEAVEASDVVASMPAVEEIAAAVTALGEADEDFDERAFAEDEDEDIDEHADAFANASVAEGAEGEAEEPRDRGSIYDQEGYLVIEDEPEGTWLTTAAGLAYLDSIDPEKQFAEQLEKHADVEDVFYDVIAYCAEEPRNITDIVNHFEDDPRLGPQTFYASYVVDRLEEIGALVWKKNWMPTELGKKLLAERVVE